MLAILETLLSSAARAQVLNLFLHNPNSQFYQREIERETGQPIRAVQREVERLEGIGLLIRSEDGNRVYYHLNPEFPLLAGLTALFLGTAGEGVEEAAKRVPFTSPEPSAIRQPFAWMETLPVTPLPAALRRMQVEGEWDRAY
jgi:DNA-binding transcriptional ArsR family regulator